MKSIKEYNLGKDKSEKWWKEFIRLLIANSFLYEKAIKDGFGSKLIMNSSAYEMLKNKEELKLNVDHEFLNL